jgi:hypothetical protein
MAHRERLAHTPPNAATLFRCAGSRSTRAEKGMDSGSAFCMVRSLGLVGLATSSTARSPVGLGTRRRIDGWLRAPTAGGTSVRIAVRARPRPGTVQRARIAVHHLRLRHRVTA